MVLGDPPLPAVTPGFTVGTIGVNSNMVSGIIPFGGPLSPGTYSIYVNFSDFQVTKNIFHGNVYKASLVFNGGIPKAYQFDINNTIFGNIGVVYFTV